MQLFHQCWSLKQEWEKIRESDIKSLFCFFLFPLGRVAHCNSISTLYHKVASSNPTNALSWDLGPSLYMRVSVTFWSNYDKSGVVNIKWARLPPFSGPNWPWRSQISDKKNLTKVKEWFVYCRILQVP